MLREAPRGSDSRIPMVTEVALRHLYAWNETLLLLGVAGTGVTRSGGRPGSAAEPLPRLERLFEGIAARSEILNIWTR